MSRLEVVCGLFLKEGQVAAFQRRASDEGVGGKWELPGGKVEAGESQEVALRRELHEELDEDCDELTFFDYVDWDYPHLSLRLNCYVVEHFRGEICLKEHQQMKWLERDSLLEVVDWADADRALLEKWISRWSDGIGVDTA